MTIIIFDRIDVQKRYLTNAHRNMLNLLLICNVYRAYTMGSQKVPGIVV